MAYRSVLAVVVLAVASVAGIAPQVSSSMASPAPVSVQDSATVMFQDGSGLAPEQVAQSPTYLDAAHGWSFSRSGNFWEASAPNGEPVDFSLSGIDVTHLHAGSRTDLQVAYDGSNYGLFYPPFFNAIIKDIAVDSSGLVTRLDVVYEDCCGATDSPEDAWDFGELRIAEPATTALQSSPSILFLPPLNRESSNRTFPVLIEPGQNTTASIAALRLTGAGSSAFSLSDDTCTAHTVTSAMPCTVNVTYHGTDRQDIAQLQALSPAGDLLSSTTLDGALLPGSTYIASTNPWTGKMQVFHADADNSFVLGYTPANITGPVDGIPEVDFWHNMYSTNTIEIAVFDAKGHLLTPGRYSLNGPNPSKGVDYSNQDITFTPYTGVIHVFQMTVHRLDRGLYNIPSFNMSFELHSRQLREHHLHQTIYGVAGAYTDIPISIPDSTPPTPLTGIRLRHHHGYDTVTWGQSSDLAVHDYVFRSLAGHHRHVGYHQGRQTNAGDRTTIRLSTTRHTNTYTLYAVDDHGHHSTGRTIAIG